MFLIVVGLFSCHANELRQAHRHLSRESTKDRPRRAEDRKRAVQPRVSDEQTVRIVEGYKAGRTVYELAAEFGYNRVTISAVLKRQSIALRRTSPTPQQIDEMTRLYESGLSLAAVGKQLGFNASTVLARLRAVGIKTRAS